MDNSTNRDGLAGSRELTNRIKKNEKRFLRILQHMPVMIWVFDRNGRLLFWNSESERVTGYSSAEMVGTKAGGDRLCADGYGLDRFRQKGSRASGENTSRGEMDIRCKDGTRKTIAWSSVQQAFPIPDWHVWILAADVTERKKAENINRVNERKNNSGALISAYRSLEERVAERTKALEATNAQLQKEYEERLYLQDRLIRSERMAATGQLAASIAHEINSPLQGISSLLAAIKRTGAQDEKLLRNISLIEDAFDRIGSTVRNLMDLNRPGKEKKQPVNLNRVVENTAALIKNYLKMKEIHIETVLAPDLPFIKASPQQIGQVLMNLINNSVEAILSVPRPGVPLKDKPAYEGIIRIRTTFDEDAVVISVADDGPGIKPADAAKVFDPFFTRRKTMGMGVGLSICYGILEDHHGTIEFNPNYEKGAECIVTLPLKAGQGEDA